MMTIIEVNEKISEHYFSTLRNLEKIIKKNDGNRKKHFSVDVQKRIRWYCRTNHTCYRCLQPIKKDDDFFIIVENNGEYIMDYRLHPSCERPFKGWC